MKQIFDDIDRKILNRLRFNGRATLHELAKETQRSSTAIRKRLLKLTRSGVLRISSLLNIQHLKFHLLFIRLEVEDAAAKDAIFDRFRQCPRLISLYSTLGTDNIIALMFAEDRNTLESEQLENCAIRSSKGIRRSDVELVTEIAYDPFLPLRIELASRNKKKAPCRANCANCKRYLDNKCLACPATIYYRGAI